MTATSLVTHDSADFTALMEREPRHPGLVCMNVAHGLMSLDVQQTLFDYAIKQIANGGLAGRIVEITLTAGRAPAIRGCEPTARSRRRCEIRSSAQLPRHVLPTLR